MNTNAELPYTDSGCVQKIKVRCFDFNDGPWGFKFKLKLGGHSKNWCMGTLNIDVWSLGIHIGPFEWFLANRLMVKPPKRSFLVYGESL